MHRVNNYPARLTVGKAITCTDGHREFARAQARRRRDPITCGSGTIPNTRVSHARALEPFWGRTATHSARDPRTQATNPLMQQLLDFLPIAVFGAVYLFTGDIYRATLVLMIATVVQVALTWTIKRHVGNQLWMVLVISLVFGGLTLALHDKQFLFWKPTIMNWAFAAILGGGVMIGRNPLQTVLGAQLELPAKVWRNLTIGWALGCFAEGALNLVVAYHFSEAFWVGYKVWGGLVITFMFVGLTAVYLVRGGHLPEEEASGAQAVGRTTPILPKRDDSTPRS